MPSITPIRRREAISFYLSIAPWLIGFLLFTAGPMLLSAYASLTHWDLITDPRPAGLDNFAAMGQDPRFWQSLKVTVLYTLAYVPLDVVGGLGLALLVRPRLRGMRAFRTIFYLPSVVAGVAFVVVWVWLLNPRGGLVNLVLGQLGIEGPNWLNDPHWALIALVLMSFWGWGRSMVIYLGGLQTIPGELYEAAAMDGARAPAGFLQRHPAAAFADHLFQPGPERYRHLPDVSPAPYVATDGPAPAGFDAVFCHVPVPAGFCLQ